MERKECDPDPSITVGSNTLLSSVKGFFIYWIKVIRQGVTMVRIQLLSICYQLDRERGGGSGGVKANTDRMKSKSRR